MADETIKSFLVGLGFGVDGPSLAKFNSAITSASRKVTSLYAATVVAAGGIAAGISKISEGFEEMGYSFHIIAPAINKTLLLRQELLKSYRLAGINIRQTVRDSVLLNLSLTKTRYAFEAIYKSVASKFFQTFTKASDAFRAKIYANMPKIQKALDTFVKTLFKISEIAIQLGQRLFFILQRGFELFEAADRATNGWLKTILEIAAAVAVLIAPFGLVGAALLFILGLFDDFKTFQEGGESFFDWSPFLPVIESVKKLLSEVYNSLDAIGNVVATVIVAAIQVFTGDFSGALRSVKSLGGEVVTVFKTWWEYLKSIWGVLSSIGNWAPAAGGWLMRTFGGGTSPAAATTGTLGSNVAPLGAGTSNNSNVNQNVSQQTTVNVQGVSDAQGVGNVVAGVSQKNNFDLQRNLKGSLQSGGQIA